MMPRTVGSALVLLVAALVGEGLAETPPDQPLYTQRSSFGIPFRVDPVALEQLGSNELRLYVSDDRGTNWNVHGSVEPGAGRFVWNAPADGEYWFAVRTVDDRGRLHPGDGQPIEPELRVIVDTRPPVLLLSPDRETGTPVLRWQVSDDHLLPESLTIQYAVPAPTSESPDQIQWKQALVSLDAAQIGNLRSGRAQLPGHVSTPVLIRAEVRDRANNVATAQRQIDGSLYTSLDPSADHDPAATAPQSGTVASNEPISLDAQQPPTSPSPRSQGQSLTRGDARRPAFPSRPAPTRNRDPRLARSSGTAQPAAPGSPTGPSNNLVPQLSGAGVQVINSTRFDLQYQLDSVGPSGVGEVELWITEDGGATWKLYGKDEDRRSPIRVDLGTGRQGLFGFTLVASSGAGLAAPPPAPGESPQMQVVADTTPPKVDLYRPLAATDTSGSHVVIRWNASDANLPETPVSLYWAASPEGPWSPIAEGLKNAPNVFSWRKLPQNAHSVYIRLIVRDRAGNQVDLQTREPLVIDLARPRAKIIGVRRS